MEIDEKPIQMRSHTPFEAGNLPLSISGVPSRGSARNSKVGISILKNQDLDYETNKRGLQLVENFFSTSGRNNNFFVSPFYSPKVTSMAGSSRP